MRSKTFIILLTCSLFCLLLSSCQGKEGPEFINSSTIGLKVKDKVIFEYDTLTWQNAFNREKCEFRVHTDNMSDYYTISLNLVPTAVDQKAKGDITWTSRSPESWTEEHRICHLDGIHIHESSDSPRRRILQRLA